MGMFSEIATEGTIGVFVTEIGKELEANKNHPEVCVALKKLGRFALTQFEWSLPDWARKYSELFKEETPSEVVARKSLWVLHHDDPPCTAKLENGYCPKCKFVPDMQSICFYYYCPDCRVELNNKSMECPQCHQTFSRERAD